MDSTIPVDEIVGQLFAFVDKKRRGKRGRGVSVNLRIHADPSFPGRLFLNLSPLQSTNEEKVVSK